MAFDPDEKWDIMYGVAHKNDPGKNSRHFPGPATLDCRLSIKECRALDAGSLRLSGHVKETGIFFTSRRRSFVRYKLDAKWRELLAIIFVRCREHNWAILTSKLMLACDKHF